MIYFLQSLQSYRSSADSRRVKDLRKTLGAADDAIGTTTSDNSSSRMSFIIYKLKKFRKILLEYNAYLFTSEI